MPEFLDIHRDGNPHEEETEKPYERAHESRYDKKTDTPYQREQPKPYVVKNKKRAKPLRHVTKERLREGIVFAEILNQPRAKFPHPSIRRFDGHRKR